MRVSGAVLFVGLVGLPGLLAACGSAASSPPAQEEILNVAPDLVGLPPTARVGEPVRATARVGMPDSCVRFRELSITYLPELSPREALVTAFIARPVGLVCLPVFWIHEERFTLVFPLAGTWEVKAGSGSPFVPTQTHTIIVAP